MMRSLIGRSAWIVALAAGTGLAAPASGQEPMHDHAHMQPAESNPELEQQMDKVRQATERYRDHARYVAAVKAAAERLVRQRFLLPDDAARLVREAEASDVLRGP